MSLKLLEYLNGKKSLRFKRWLNDIFRFPNIAWYPSSGGDFRALMYLSKAYSKFNPAKIKETIFPDIFLFTDYHPWSEPPEFLKREIIHQDRRTIVKRSYIEELKTLSLPLDREIVDFPKKKYLYGKVFYMEVNVFSKILGELSYPVIYVISENEAFCAKVLLPLETRLSHIVRVRYGGGCGGGGKSRGAWLFGVLKKLHVKVFITDSSSGEGFGDYAALELYPELRGEKPKLKPIRTIDSIRWSCYGDVTWYIVE